MKPAIIFLVNLQILLIFKYVTTKNTKTFSSFPANSNIVINDEVPKIKEPHDPAHRITPSRNCLQPAVCEELMNTTCFGAKLSYKYTSLKYAPRIENQNDIWEKLESFKGWKAIPRCWPVVQQLLCALMMPKCEDGLVEFPSKEMFEAIQSPCSIIGEYNGWPPEFKYNTSFESHCVNAIRGVKFPLGECPFPLVPVTDEDHFYPGFEGCGLPCHNALFTDEERQDVRTTIRWGSTMSCLCNGFAVITYLINRPFTRKYPAQAVFWINLCFFLVSLGFHWQFMGSHERTICRADGTVRTSEPSRENLSCVMNFTVVYYSLVAGIVWCITFAYTWLLRSQTYDKIKSRKDKWSSYYHMVAWAIPLVLTVIIAALQQIDGDGLWGICIVGVQNKAMRLIFVLGPLLGLIIACSFLGFCILKLIYLDRTSKEVMSKRAKEKIRESIWKLTVFLFSIAIFMLITFYCQFHEWYHSTLWKDSFREYLVCQLHVTGVEPEKCSLPDRPNVSLVQLQLFILFLFFISAAAWIFTACSTVDTWKRFIYKNLLRQEVEENIKLKKYKVIARAFEKRKCLDSNGLSNGVISIDIRRSHQDPVGLDFDLNSIGSNESTTWVKIIPQLMKRRAGIIPVSHSNRNSTDSEISYSYTEFQRSRRQSLDSTQETTSFRHIEFTAKPCSKRRRKNRRRTQSCSPEITLKKPTKRFEDELEVEVLQALKIGNFKVESSGAPHTKRRMAITEIDMDSLKFLSMEKKFLDNPAGDSSSSSGESEATNDESKSVNSESANNSICCQETENV